MSSPSSASLFVSRINSPHCGAAIEYCQRTLVVAHWCHPSYPRITASLGKFTAPPHGPRKGILAGVRKTRENSAEAEGPHRPPGLDRTFHTIEMNARRLK